MNEIEIAKICHEANKAYCETLGDQSQPYWRSAPVWQKDSAIDGVQAHLVSDLTPEQSHNKWWEHKIANGWKHGTEKDTEKKIHPCMIAYNDLPIEQRRKDQLFKSIVDCFKEALGG